MIPKKRIPFYSYKNNDYIYAVNTYLLIVYHPNIKKNKYIINNIFNII